jgi:hypothetical protein
MLSRKEIRLLKQTIKPMLQEGKTVNEITVKLNSAPNMTYPWGEITRHTVAYHATRTLRKRGARRLTRTTTPVKTGSIDRLADILTMPGLTDSQRLAIIKIMVA